MLKNLFNASLMLAAAGALMIVISSPETSVAWVKDALNGTLKIKQSKANIITEVKLFKKDPTPIEGERSLLIGYPPVR